MVRAKTVSTPKAADASKRKACAECVSNKPAPEENSPATKRSKAVVNGKTKKVDTTPSAKVPSTRSKKASSSKREVEPPAKSKPSPIIDNEEGEEEEEEAEIQIHEGNASEEEEVDEALAALAADLDPEHEAQTNQAKSTYKPGQDVGKIPALPKTKNNKKASSEQDAEAGIVYIGRVPHGFYEQQMRQYFSQFGPINRMFLARNPKTGASRHYAFIEFAEASTAEIVAKTMNNYLMFGHLLKVSVVPKERFEQEGFRWYNSLFRLRRATLAQEQQISKKVLSQARTVSEWQQRLEQETERRATRAEKLAAIGYDFAYPTMKKLPKPVSADVAAARVADVLKKQEEDAPRDVIKAYKEAEGIDSDEEEELMMYENMDVDEKEEEEEEEQPEAEATEEAAEKESTTKAIEEGKPETTLNDVLGTAEKMPTSISSTKKAKKTKVKA